jgi:hypothetical protein
MTLRATLLGLRRTSRETGSNQQPICLSRLISSGQAGRRNISKYNPVIHYMTSESLLNTGYERLDGN